MSPNLAFVLLVFSHITFSSCAHAVRPELESEAEEAHRHGDDAELSRYAYTFSCKKASAAQIAEVENGNAKKDAFLEACAKETEASPWCLEVIRPNPESLDLFACTYGSELPHQLIHPNEATWKNAIRAVRIMDELQTKGIAVCQISNWWRPEPYNKNVGGAAGRHPFGTSVDVRFCTLAAKEEGFTALCQMRKKGVINAVGYYSTKALHVGVGDTRQNTWGKACP